MTNEVNDNKPQPSSNRPDYVAVCYPMIRLSNGWRRRKAIVGGAWQNDNGSICFRPSGKQIFEDDVYLFPANDDASAGTEAKQAA